jgi:hypothetical protein
MVAGIYAILWLACSFTLCVFGFFAGRCARKLPILDNNLPWTLHRSQLPPEDCHARHKPAAGPAHWPQDSLQGLITTARPSRGSAAAPRRGRNDRVKVNSTSNVPSAQRQSASQTRSVLHAPVRCHRMNLLCAASVISRS